MAVERNNSISGQEPLKNNPNGLPAQGKSVAGEQGIDKQYLAAPVKSAVDKFQLIPEFLKVRGLVKQHLDSFNYFVNIGIKKIIRANGRIELRNGEHYLRFKDIWIGEPSMPVDGIDRELTPQQCRLSDLTYSAPIFVNIEYTVESSGQVVKKD